MISSRHEEQIIALEHDQEKKGRFLAFIDGEEFDYFLGKVTNGLFRLILVAGIPYFIYVLSKFLYFI